MSLERSTTTPSQREAPSAVVMRGIRAVAAKIVLSIAIVFGSVQDSGVAQQKQKPAVPEHVQKRVIHQNIKEQRSRYMIVIAHHHGDPIFSRVEDIPNWIAHQDEILDILLQLSTHHRPEKTRFFFEGEKGPYAKWPEKTSRSIAPLSQKAFQAWKAANAETKKTIAAKFTKELGKTQVEKMHEIWNRYHPALGLASYGKDQKVEDRMFGSEPPKEVPFMPDPELLLKERPDVFHLRMNKMILSNIIERNRYAALGMEKAVPKDGVGVLLIGGAHNSSVHDRYPKKMNYFGVSGEFGLETHLSKIVDANVVVIEPTTFKSLSKEREAP